MTQHAAIIHAPVNDQVDATSVDSLESVHAGNDICTVPLNPRQACLLTLVHLDPRLTYLGDRERMRLIVTYFDPTFDHQRVGRAYARLKELHVQGALRTQAFVRSDKRPEGPERCLAKQVVNELGARWGWDDLDVKQRHVRLQRVLRLLGHEL